LRRHFLRVSMHPLSLPLSTHWYWYPALFTMFLVTLSVVQCQEHEKAEDRFKVFKSSRPLVRDESSLALMRAMLASLGYSSESYLSFSCSYEISSKTRSNQEITLKEIVEPAGYLVQAGDVGHARTYGSQTAPRASGIQNAVSEHTRQSKFLPASVLQSIAKIIADKDYTVSAPHTIGEGDGKRVVITTLYERDERTARGSEQVWYLNATTHIPLEVQYSTESGQGGGLVPLKTTFGLFVSGIGSSYPSAYSTYIGSSAIAIAQVTGANCLGALHVQSFFSPVVK
jgi:hypothetical protein